MKEKITKEDGVYMMKNGKFEKVDTPLTGYGKQIINWRNGKLTHYEVNYTKE